MIVRPAVDLRDGHCVQLVGGSYDSELFRLDNPVEVARDWIIKGFSHLHIVDLDRATSRGSNVEIVKDIAAMSNSYDGLDIRVGGGVRSTSDVEELFSVGVSSIVVGTQAIANHEWLQEIVARYPGKIYVAIEVDGQDVKVHGWQEKSEFSLQELLSRYETIDIAGIFVTAIHVEGQQQGTDIDLFRSITSWTDKDVVASGGVTTIADIEALHDADIAEVVVGAAIYSSPDLVNTLQENLENSRYKA